MPTKRMVARALALAGGALGAALALAGPAQAETDLAGIDEVATPTAVIHTWPELSISGTVDPESVIASTFTGATDTYTLTVTADGSFLVRTDQADDTGFGTPTGRQTASPPPGQDPGQLPPGQDPGQLPPGQDPGQLPPGQDPGVVPPGQDPGVVPPGQDPG
ncbi:MAG TPA: hypothetical protein VNA14_00760, partial [Mycobacteriales bacterium]|nr:hypothetical protein [Mycobacteriales bacterium]